MQKFKKIISVVLALITILVFTACSGSDKNLGVSYDLKQEPKNLDPQAAIDNASLTIINNTMEGLLTLGTNGEIKNATASSYTISPDKLIYTFMIDKDAKWSNEEKVTSKDFLFTFQRLLLKTTNSPYSKLFFCIDNAKSVYEDTSKMATLGVSAPSNDKLIIKLNKPNDNFLKLLTMPCAVACNQKYFESTRGKYGLEANTMISNGAFIVKNWQHEKSIRLTKNENYHNEKEVKSAFVSLYIDTSVQEIKQSSKTSEQVSSGANANASSKPEEIVKDNTADRLINEDTLSAMMDGFSSNELDEKMFTKSAVNNSTWGIAFNFNNKLMENKSLRNAIALAFDKESYKKHLDKNLSLANAIIPSGVMAQAKQNKSFREIVGEEVSIKYDSTKAYSAYKQALTELKAEKTISGNQIRSLDIIVPIIPNIKLEEYFSYPSQILQQNLGIFINIKVLTQNEYKSALKTGEYDCAIVDLIASDNTPRSILAQFKTDSKDNFYGYSNLTVDKMLEEADAKTNEEEIIKTFANIEKLLIEETVFIPMYYKTDYFVINNIISNLEYNKYTGLVSFKNVIKAK